MTERRMSATQSPPSGPRPGPGGPGPGGPGGHFMRPKERAKNIRGTVLRLWAYLKKQGWGLGIIVILVSISSGLGLLGPYLMGKAIDDFILKNDIPGLGRLLLLMLGVYVVGASINWLEAYLMSTVAQRTVRDLRNDLFAKLQTLSLRFFDQRTHGELMSRLANDVENVSNVLNGSITQLISSVLSLAGVAVMMFVINWRLALVSIITLPLMMVLSNTIARYTRQGFREQQEYLGDLNGIIEETITGQHVVKAYVREQAVIEAFGKVNVKLRKAASRAQIFAGTLGPISNFVNNVGFAIVAGAGGWMAVQGMATVGTIAAFINYARQFSMPLNQIANLYNSIQSAIAGARLAALGRPGPPLPAVERPPPLQDPPTRARHASKALDRRGQAASLRPESPAPPHGDEPSEPPRGSTPPAWRAMFAAVPWLMRCRGSLGPLPLRTRRRAEKHTQEERGT